MVRFILAVLVACTIVCGVRADVEPNAPKITPAELDNYFQVSCTRTRECGE